MTEEELIDESVPIGGLGQGVCRGRTPEPRSRSDRYEYAFPPQEYGIQVGDEVECPITDRKDVLVVAPYNSQVQLIQEHLSALGYPNARVGTVDKFQGQEAPVVLYSMATSNPEDAPRGFDFLFSLNRLNVATSRSQAIVILIASPRLLEAQCSMPRQMRLVNAFCGAVEEAGKRGAT
ncbi:MAG: C-terminal helicase domain-containing protein [Deltaproteobacteria bacterium]